MGGVAETFWMRTRIDTNSSMDELFKKRIPTLEGHDNGINFLSTEHFFVFASGMKEL